jgi:F0F1-type ATP synthase assembly protein I
MFNKTLIDRYSKKEPIYLVVFFPHGFQVGVLQLAKGGLELKEHKRVSRA